MQISANSAERRIHLVKRSVLLGLSLAALCHGQEFTRGIGVYRGDPQQYDGPRLAVDSTTYRNLTQRQPAHQSSAYDYNLTAQLATDGIHERGLPQRIDRLDLGANCTFDHVALAWIQRPAVAFIQVSGDASQRKTKSSNSRKKYLKQQKKQQKKKRKEQKKAQKKFKKQHGIRN